MTGYKPFHSQLASIMEALTKAALTEICELVDEGYAELQLEISRSHRENEALRRKLELIETIVVRGSSGGKAAEALLPGQEAETAQQQRDSDGGDTAAAPGADGGAAVGVREEVKTWT